MPFKSLEERRKYQREHYEQNKSRYSKRKRACRADTRTRLRQIVLEAKGTHCLECKDPHPPWVLQFDHLGDDKKGDIATMVGRCVSEKVLRAEIAKCEVVCANCHADRTHKRRIIGV